MPDLDFKLAGAEVTKFSAAPEIVFKLEVTNADRAENIHSVMLRGQVQIEVTRRQYAPGEQEKLRDLFGEPDRWSQTLRNLSWTHVSVNLPPFQGETVVDFPVPCTFDFNVGATKYFYGLGDGKVPLCFLFSGAIFYSHSGGPMQVAPIPWKKESRFNLPVKVWRDMMDTFYPGTAWICLSRDVFEQLYNYKVRHGIPTWEKALQSILQPAESIRS